MSSPTAASRRVSGIRLVSRPCVRGSGLRGGSGASRACMPGPETSALHAGSLSRRRPGCEAGVSAAGRRPGQGARATARRDRPPALAADAGTSRPRRHVRHSGTASPHCRQHIRPAAVSGTHVPAGAHEAEEPIRPAQHPTARAPWRIRCIPLPRRRRVSRRQARQMALRSFPGRRRVPVVTLMRERVVVRVFGEDPGFGEYFVHPVGIPKQGVLRCVVSSGCGLLPSCSG
jgi:hypothetical protein